MNRCDKCGSEKFTYPSGTYCPRCELDKIKEIADEMMVKVNEYKRISKD